MRVDAGTYVNDFVTVTHKITMESVGGMAVMLATQEPPNGKAIITADASLTIDGFGFTGAAVSDQNGCGIRYEAGDLVVRNSVFWNNQEGILANGVPDGTVVIERSEFSHNGAGDGRSHNIYIGTIASLVVRDSYFHDSVVGHEIKSRASSNVITGNRIYDNAGNGSYSIDLPQGGVSTVTANVIEKGASTENWISIHFGGEEGPHANSSLVVSGNTIVNDNPNGYLITNSIDSASVSLTGNQLWGWQASNVSLGPVTVSNNTELAARPTLDLSTRAPAVTAPPVVPIPTDPGPGGTPSVPIPAYQDFGRAGAVTPSGNILTVGAHGQYTSLAAALIASHDGDTIQVAAGTYVNDFGVVTHKVIIEGVGGMARFTQKADLYDVPAGLLTVSADATIRNVEIFGSHGNGREPGLRVTAGNVTLVNDYLHDNDVGLWADAGVNTTVSVYDSELGSNGDVGKGTNNVQINSIGSFTLIDSYVHGAISGHEIYDRAYNSVIRGDRIIDGPGVAASFLLNFGQGGNAVVTDNMLAKGTDAANGVLVHVGGEANVYTNSNVQLTGNTFFTGITGGGHPYTYFVVNDVAKGTVPLTVTGNTFVGGVPGSMQVVNGTGTGNSTASTAVLDTSAPWSASAAPVLKPDRTGPNVLKLSLTERPAQLDAQFIVSVDGTDIGGGWVTAKDGIDPAQTYTFTGWWGTGIHNVTVRATNALYKGAPGSLGVVVNKVSLDDSALTGQISLDYFNPSWTGALFGKDILPDFDATFYLARNPDVAAARVDPLQHYLTYGWREGRNPNAWFDTRYYLNQNPEVAASGVNPLKQFASAGWAEGRDPSVRFSVSQYLTANPDVAAANVDPLQDYMQSIRSGSTSRTAFAATPHALSADPLFDSARYYAAHPDVAATGIDAAAHYHSQGWTQGYDPDSWFSTNFYLSANPDVAAAGIDPFQHFTVNGWHEGRDPSPYFSLSRYNAAHPGSAASGVDPLLSFIQSGEAASAPRAYASPEAALFDPQYYNAHNPDVVAAHVDPLLHYQTYGWHEGRDPSAAFSTTKYLAAYTDVRDAQMDPLAHYALYGRGEGRSEFTV